MKPKRDVLKKRDVLNALDSFIAGVPPLGYFELEVRNITELAKASKADEGNLDPTTELCFIGLAAYFEAFCKSQFAAIINICPETLKVFTSKRECSVNARNLLYILPKPKYRLGSLIAEEYDFGCAKSINSLFVDLLNITPFSKDESGKYADFLNDRNLFVHHGGVYTFKYAKQKLSSQSIQRKVHFDSLVVGKADVLSEAAFLLKIAKKTADASGSALTKFIAAEKIKMSAARKKAIWYLGHPSEYSDRH